MPNGSVCSSDAPFCQYSVEVLVSISSGSVPSPRKSEPLMPVSGSLNRISASPVTARMPTGMKVDS